MWGKANPKLMRERESTKETQGTKCKSDDDDKMVKKMVTRANLLTGIE